MFLFILITVTDRLVSLRIVTGSVGKLTARAVFNRTMDKTSIVGPFPCDLSDADQRRIRDRSECQCAYPSERCSTFASHTPCCGILANTEEELHAIRKFYSQIEIARVRQGHVVNYAVILINKHQLSPCPSSPPIGQEPPT